MKTTKRLISALLALLLALSLTACDKGSDKVDIPTTQTGSDDFQKNLHQYIKPDHNYSFVETDAGYYFCYSSLYFIDKDTKTGTKVCAKPDCDHTDDNICNARIHARYLLTGGERIYFVPFGAQKLVRSVKPDATERKDVQELKYDEFSVSQSSNDQAIYHRGYIYYASDDILYRVKLGGDKDSAEVIWSPANAGETQEVGGMLSYNPNWIHYTLWAEEETLYFMANVQTSDGTYKDVLFQCDLSDMSVRQVWATPDKDEAGEWETTGVEVSQWYVTGGIIYFYLGGNGLWRTDLASGQTEKLADTGGKISYGSAVYSDGYVCIANDIPKMNATSSTLSPGSPLRFDADTIFVYGMDGSLLKEISLQSIFDESDGASAIDMLFCDSTDVYFLITEWTYSNQFGFPVGNTGATILYRANFETGEVTQVYKLR